MKGNFKIIISMDKGFNVYQRVYIREGMLIINQKEKGCLFRSRGINMMESLEQE